MTVPISNMTVTWNTGATTFSAIKMNATDTASAAASALLDLQVSNASRFKVVKDGTLNWGAITYTLTPSTTSFTDGLLTTNKDFIVRRQMAVGSHGSIGEVYTAPGGQEEEENDRFATFCVNDYVHSNPIFGGTGIKGSFGLKAEGNTGGVNSFSGIDVFTCGNVENIGDFNGGLYLASFGGINFSTTVSVTNWNYYGVYVFLTDYGNENLPCRSSYTDFVGLYVETQHRGVGTATNVVGVQVFTCNGQAGLTGGSGTCTNLTGVDIRKIGTYQNITNAIGLVIRDWSTIGASTKNYNIHSLGVSSINLFEGVVRLGTATNASPTDGDLWFDGTNLKFRTGGVTKTVTLT